MDYNGEGVVFAGASGPGNLTDVTMKYGKDAAGALLYLKRGTTKLMHMIHEQFGKRDVTSFTPTWWDITELDDIYTVSVAQTISADIESFRRITLTNDQAMQLQAGDILYVDGLFLADGRNSGTSGTYSRAWTSTHMNEEQMLVMRQPEPDSAGSGYSFVTVRRGYLNNSITGRLQDEPTSANWAGGALQVGDRLLHGGNVQWTGSDAPHGKGKNLVADTNPLQIMRWAFEDQTETEMEKTFLRETPLTIAQKLALNKMAYEMEWRALFNQPVKEQEGNKWRYAMGGLFHYLDQTSNHIDYSLNGTQTTLTWPAWQRNVMAPLFALGGSSTKVGYCSIAQFTEFSQILWNKVSITINSAWSAKFGFEIYSVMGGGGTLNLVPSWVYGRNRFRSQQILVLDFGGPYFKLDILEDLHINRGPNGQGLQLPGQRLKKFEYVTVAGMQRRAKPYHALITGLPAIAGGTGN
jgi:hypothetical protein